MASIQVTPPHTRSRPNRAVAAVREARGDTAQLSAAVFPPLGAYPTADPDAEPVVRYACFEDMLKAAQRPDPLPALKAKLQSLEPAPEAVDEARQLVDAVWYRIMCFAGLANARDIVQLSATCRRLRVLALQYGQRSGAFATVNVVPHLLTLPELSHSPAFDAVAAYVTAPGRAASVRHFAMVESKFASTVPWNNAAFPVQVSLAPTLGLVARLPELATLDVRGVAWDCRSGASLALLLPDLYLVAPQLETLKVGLEVMALWTPRWWERLPHLRAFVVASRREQPRTPLSTDESGTTPAPVGPPPPLELPPDFSAFLSAEQRQWSIKLWCPLSAESALQLLFPASPHTGLVELTLNATGPAATALMSSCTASTSGLSEAGEAAGKKTKVKKSVTQAVEPPLLPALTTLTVANADVLPGLAPQLFQRLSPTLAPALVHFNLCNTVCVPAAERKPKKKPAAAADAAAST